MIITKEAINERFIDAVNFLLEKDNSLTKKQIAEILNISSSRFSEILSSRMNAGADILANFCVEYNIDITWLFTGLGSMIIDAETTQEKPKEMPTQHLELKQSPDIYSGGSNIISIPIVDVSAAAGNGFFNSDHPETLGELNWPADMLKKKYGNYYCGRVNGESMAPTLLYQDYIIFRLLSFDEWEGIKDDEIYFIVDRSGASYVKRVKNIFKKKGFIICQSDNTDKANFRDFEVQADDIANIYHVEWRFSKDLSNINQLYYDRVGGLENKLLELEKLLKGKQK